MSHPEPTPSDVDEILDNSLDTTSLQAHIDASAHTVEDIKAADSSISDAQLEDLHKYLAAYYATSQERQLSSQSGESRSLSYSSEDSSSYFELAKRLDPTGKVADKAKPKATFGVPDAKGLSE